MFKILILSLLLVAGCASKDKGNEAASDAKATTKKAATKAADKAKTKAMSAAVETLETITCSFNSDTRKINSVKVGSGGCEVRYEKFGSSKVIANAANDLSYCSQIANKVSNNLEEAGFTCK